MRKIVICLAFVLLSVGVAYAQTKSMIGTVVERPMGNRWGGIVIKVGNKKYYIQTSSAASPADPEQKVVPTPKLVGTVEEIGRRVRVFYTKIVKDDSGYDGELKATRIVELKKSRR